MAKRNTIKVFHPHSKRAAFSVLCVSPEKGAQRVGQMIDEDTASKVRSAFRSLKRLGADNLTFHSAGGRKIKVELAAAA